MKPLPQIIQVGRFRLSREHPYIASVLWAFSFIEKPGLLKEQGGLMGVDRFWRCYYDPEHINEFSPEEMIGALYHEVNHILREHLDRGKAYENQVKFNLAGDMEINPQLIKCGFQLPKGAIFPNMMKLPDGLLAEEYYEKLSQGQKDSGQGGLGAGNCGSCAHGQEQAGEDPAPTSKDQLTKAERELIKRECARGIEEASKSRGDIPDALKRWAEGLLHPQVKWTKELASVVRRAMVEVAGKQDYTYRRPSRRSVLNDFLLPTMKAYLPKVGVVIDTSGSMGSDDSQKAVSETKGILDALSLGGDGVVEIAVDCAVHVNQRLRHVKSIDLRGGGGTDMRIGISKATEIKPPLDVVVVMTDGLTPWPFEAPPFKTVVVLTQAGEKARVPTWAKTIVLN